MTSMDVCRRIRARTGGAKVGHAGTLDPLASGVLVVCFGKATKAIDVLMAGEKRYTADINLAAFSTTDDLEGEQTPVAIATPPTIEQVQAACAQFVGVIQQRPPVYSAVHVDGQRAYKTARRAEKQGAEALAQVERPPARPVTIHDIAILEYDWPLLRLDIRCAKGTYIRSLARDLGESLATGGMLSALVRTGVGEFTLSDAIPLANLPDPLQPSHLREIPAASADGRNTNPTSEVSPGDRAETPAPETQP